jgi:hypothetical protein
MKSPGIMFVYALFLAASGFTAFALAGFDWTHAKTALIVGLGTAAAMVLCAALASMYPRNKPAAMVGIHVGLVLPLVFAGLFGWRSYKTFSTGGDAKLYLAIVLAVMAVGSLVAFILIAMKRPNLAARSASAG